MNKLSHLKPSELDTKCLGKKMVDVMQVFFGKTLIGLGSSKRTTSHKLKIFYITYLKKIIKAKH